MKYKSLINHIKKLQTNQLQRHIIIITKQLIIGILLPTFFFVSCQNEIPEADVFDNPLDEEEVEYETPALTFYPIEINTSPGGSFPIDVFVLGVEELAGSYVQLQYDKSKLQVVSINVGSFFSDATQAPIFMTDIDDNNGIIHLNTSFLGSDSISVSGTGSLAEIVFTSLSAGESNLTFDATCELADPDDVSIEIKGFGVGAVNAK